MRKIGLFLGILVKLRSKSTDNEFRVNNLALRVHESMLKYDGLRIHRDIFQIFADMVQMLQDERLIKFYSVW